MSINGKKLNRKNKPIILRTFVTSRLHLRILKLPQKGILLAKSLGRRGASLSLRIM
jgi:hypothetical protein